MEMEHVAAPTGNTILTMCLLLCVANSYEAGCHVFFFSPQMRGYGKILGYLQIMVRTPDVDALNSSYNWTSLIPHKYYQ